MESEEIKRNDFPRTGDGYDRASVDAHLAAVAAWVAALEARIAAMGVERAAIEAQKAAAPVDTPEPGDLAGDGESPVADRNRPSAETVRPSDPGAARLVASERLLAGTAPGEVAAEIESRFEIDDAAALVEEVRARLA